LTSQGLGKSVEQAKAALAVKTGACLVRQISYKKLKQQFSRYLTAEATSRLKVTLGKGVSSSSSFTINYSSPKLFMYYMRKYFIVINCSVLYEADQGNRKGQRRRPEGG
jgi:hypothetical protein